MKTKPNQICKECGESEPHCAKGMCRKCYTKVYNDSHKLEIVAYGKEYRKTHKSEEVARHKEYERTHKVERAEYAKEYSKTHKLQSLAATNKYRANHPGVNTTSCRKYKATHPSFTFLGRSLPLKHHTKVPEGYVYHHMCYDHNDPEAYIVLMSRNDHNRAHRTMEKLGIRIPHINQHKAL